MKSSTDITVDQFIHVIFVPFRICANLDEKDQKDKNEKKDKVCLTSTQKFLVGSPWRAISNHHIDNPLKELWPQLQQYQARAYFHPFVQRFLYGNDRVQRFTYDDVKAIKVDFGKKTFLLNVTRCELVLFQPDIGVLLLELSSINSQCLQDTQLLLDSVRRLYPPYFNQYEQSWKSGHCPDAVEFLEKDKKTRIGNRGIYGEAFKAENTNPPDIFKSYSNVFEASTGTKAWHCPWAAHWRTLLEPFNTDPYGKSIFSAHQFGDDRAPTMSYLAVNNPRLISRGNWMRLCFSDAPGDDPLPYACAFTAKFEENFCYDRYWYALGESTNQPSRILNCGYSFGYVGSSQDKYFFTNENNGAHATFRNIYVTMGLMAHFQRASLLAASERLSEMVKRKKRKESEVKLPDRDEVREFYDQFIEFTQNFWFDEISPQEQGQQIFQMWRKHLRIQELYDEVRQELKDLVDYAELRATGDEIKASNDLNQTVAIVGGVGVVLALISAFAGIFGMNQMKEWVPVLAIPLLLFWVPTFCVIAKFTPFIWRAIRNSGKKSTHQFDHNTTKGLP